MFDADPVTHSFGQSIGEPHTTTRGIRISKLEQLEARNYMAADLHLGAVYYEDASGDDAAPDVISVTYEGGAAGTQLNHVVIVANVCKFLQLHFNPRVIINT